VTIPTVVEGNGITQDPADSLTMGRAIGAVYIEHISGGWVSLSDIMVADGHAGRTKLEQPQP
jgi:endonuclease YncB( thermonuclease family)